MTIWIAKIYSIFTQTHVEHFEMAARAGFHAMAKLKKIQLENKGEHEIIKIYPFGPNLIILRNKLYINGLQS